MATTKSAAPPKTATNGLAKAGDHPHGDIIPKARFSDAWLVVDSLVVPPEYQRPPRERIIRQIVAELDPDALQKLTVSRRSDGSDNLIDGQNRRIALQRIGYGQELAPCLLYEGLTIQEEAALFGKLNGVRGNTSALEIFYSDLAAEKPEAVAVQKVCESAGVAIDFSRRRSGACTGAVSTLRRTYNRGGRSLLYDSLVYVRRAYGTENRAYSSKMIGGMGTFLGRHGKHPNFDPERLVDLLQRMPLNILYAKALQAQEVVGSNGESGIARALLTIYNHGLRQNFRLPVPGES